MKLQKVNLSLPKDLVRQVKALAKKRGVSLNEFICAALEGIIKKETEYLRARDRQIALMMTGFDLGAHGRTLVSRVELHGRQ